MDRFQIWLYLIIAVVYFLSRMRKKQTDQPGQLPDIDPERQAGTPAKRAVPQTLTFEDLLREITQSKVQPKEEAVVDYDDDLQDEAQDLEDVDYDYRKDDKAFETYEEAKKQAFSRPSLEETMKVGDTVMGFGKFKEFDKAEQRNLAAEYLKDFRDPGSLKKAVVMSEILKTKF
ncbi:MAG: hypothetical protein OEV74_15055 [Cyclobacteriaceae bacterium]|nr:hypothetical protein [Cyclobacteriaceae bacterium]MDH4297597.1 hypothetical protein [Cyclobacteriaceae bacterium]MDH5250528.1 hypothetical protein [Cyclobacteriaceae bacterium]